MFIWLQAIRRRRLEAEDEGGPDGGEDAAGDIDEDDAEVAELKELGVDPEAAPAAKKDAKAAAAASAKQKESQEQQPGTSKDANTTIKKEEETDIRGVDEDRAEDDEPVDELHSEDEDSDSDDGEVKGVMSQAKIEVGTNAFWTYYYLPVWPSIGIKKPTQYYG